MNIRELELEINNEIDEDNKRIDGVIFSISFINGDKNYLVKLYGCEAVKWSSDIKDALIITEPNKKYYLEYVKGFSCERINKTNILLHKNQYTYRRVIWKQE